MTTVSFNRSITFSDELWDLWDKIYVNQTLLDISDSLLALIHEVGSLLNKSSQPILLKFQKISRDLSEFNGLIYCFSFFYTTQLIIEDKFIDRTRLFFTASNISLFISDILTPFYWLHEKGIIYLGRCCNLVGNGIEIFEGLSYLFSACSDIQTVFKEEWNGKRVRAIVNLIWFMLWTIGKILEKILSPTHATTIILTILSLARLAITLVDALS